MDERSVILNFTLVVFSVSFTWMVTERIASFPKIRRFYALGALFSLHHKSRPQRARIKSDLFVLLSSWTVILVSLSISLYLMVRYARSLSQPGGYSLITHIFLVPSLFFLAPQFMSRLISSLVLWLAKFEVRYMFRRDRRQFDIFSESWKRDYGLTEQGIRTGLIHKKCFQRSRESLLYLILIYLGLFVTTR